MWMSITKLYIEKDGNVSKQIIRGYRLGEALDGANLESSDPHQVVGNKR